MLVSYYERFTISFYEIAGINEAINKVKSVISPCTLAFSKAAIK